MPYYEQIIFYAAINCLALYILIKAMRIFLIVDPDAKIAKKFISYSVYLFVGIFTYFHTENIYLNVIINIILVYILSVNFSSDIIKKLYLLVPGSDSLLLLRCLSALCMSYYIKKFKRCG